MKPGDEAVEAALQPAGDADAEPRWMTRWLDGVDASSMSQRRLTSIERHGGLDRLADAARRRGVHLVRLTDDAGHELVAASRHAFHVIC